MSPIKKQTGSKLVRKSNAFRDAYETALERLAACIKERGHCNERLAYLNVEIPQLEQTVAVLDAQMKPRKQADPAASMNITPATSIKPNQEPSFEGMASIPVVIKPGMPSSVILDAPIEELEAYD